MIKILILLIFSFSFNISSMPIDNLDDIRGDWAMISDQVMGGVSEVNFYELEEEGDKFYRLEGVVSTANNGGFIQSVVRIKENTNGYKGLRIKVRGTKDKY